MKFDYPFKREDYLKFLKLTNRKSNIACMVIFTIIYFIAVFDLLKENLTSVFLFYGISMVVLYSILKVVSTLFANLVLKQNDKILEYSYGTYHVSINKTSIQEEIKDKKFEIKFNAIAHVRVSKEYFVVEPKEKGLVYIFMKSSFKTEEKYKECKEMVLKYFKEAKQDSIEEKDFKEEKTSKTNQNSPKKKPQSKKKETKKVNTKKK